jgi:hypothetical protein
MVGAPMVRSMGDPGNSVRRANRLNDVHREGGTGSSAPLALADGHRDRLPAADRLYLDVRRGTGDPNAKTDADRLAEWAALTQALLDRVEAWYFEAETYMHRRLWRHTDWAQRAIAMFQRALDVDPNHIPSQEHIFFVRSMVGPTPTDPPLSSRPSYACSRPRPACEGARRPGSPRSARHLR